MGQNSGYERDFNELIFESLEHGARPSGRTHQPQAGRPTGHYEVERPNGQYAEGSPNGQFAFAVEGPTGQFGIDRSTGQFEVERPAGQYAVERPMGRQDAGRPNGQFDFKQVLSSGFQVAHVGSRVGDAVGVLGKTFVKSGPFVPYFSTSPGQETPPPPVSREALEGEEASCVAWTIPCVKPPNRGA